MCQLCLCIFTFSEQRIALKSRREEKNFDDQGRTWIRLTVERNFSCVQFLNTRVDGIYTFFVAFNETMEDGIFALEIWR